MKAPNFVYQIIGHFGHIGESKGFDIDRLTIAPTPEIALEMTRKDGEKRTFDLESMTKLGTAHQ